MRCKADINIDELLSDIDTCNGVSARVIQRHGSDSRVEREARIRQVRNGVVRVESSHEWDWESGIIPNVHNIHVSVTVQATVYTVYPPYSKYPRLKPVGQVKSGALVGATIGAVRVASKSNIQLQPSFSLNRIDLCASSWSRKILRYPVAKSDSCRS